MSAAKRYHLSASGWVKVALIALLGLVIVGGGAFSFWRFGDMLPFFHVNGFQMGPTKNSLGAHDWRLGAGSQNLSSSGALKQIRCQWDVSELKLVVVPGGQLSVSESSPEVLRPAQQVHWALDDGTLYLLSDLETQTGLWQPQDKTVVVDLPVSTAGLANADFKLGSGDLDLGALQAQKLTCDCGVGDVTGDGVVAQELTVDGGVGDARLSGSFSNITENGGVGDVNISSAVAPQSIQAVCGVGDSDFKIAVSSGFSATVKTGVGDFDCGFATTRTKVGGAQVYRFGDGSRSYDFTVGVGDLTLAPLS
ncbi:MAG: DUF4097 domain-containing protein [Coriobacteriales bacterium]|jgi:hypothetical protein|nr:DUF4097 domain-containing protein [Coriobacteriales bacterium]